MSMELWRGRLVSKADQDDHMDYLDFRQALQKLPADQREALILIGGSGLSYEEAAEICKCAVGTMKSRVSRARSRLTELLEAEPAPAQSNGRRCKTSTTSQLPTTRRRVRRLYLERQITGAAA